VQDSLSMTRESVEDESIFGIPQLQNNNKQATSEGKMIMSGLHQIL
jgi:hypothetical protein